MNIIMKDTKGCGKLSSNHNLLDYGWLIGVKTAEEETANILDYFGPVKTSHKGFFLAKLEKWTKKCPVGSHIVMKISPRVTGDRPIMYIGYKYIYEKVLGFISTEGAIINLPCVPYLSCFF